MKYVNPSAEYWRQGDDRVAHVAKCARVCYASNKTTDNERLVQMLASRKHMSMFRHESRYFIIRNVQKNKLTWPIHYMQNSQYVACFVLKKQTAYISTNGQWVRENVGFVNKYLGNNEVTEEEFIREAIATGDKRIEMLVRHTVCVVTQISTSRELNRKSPNNIAEQSTRYVNFGKRGGITICRPWWMGKAIKHRILCSLLMRLGWHIDDLIYRLLVWLGMKPQDARGKLPLDAATKVVYTYNGYEWKEIFDLRLRQLTGKAHPNAQCAASLIYEQIQQELIKMNIGKLDL